MPVPLDDASLAAQQQQVLVPVPDPTGRAPFILVPLVVPGGPAPALAFLLGHCAARGLPLVVTREPGAVHDTSRAVMTGASPTMANTV